MNFFRVFRVLSWLIPALALLFTGCASIPPGGTAPNVLPGISYHHYLQPRCQWCNSTHDLNVHHIEPQHLHPELRDVPSNLVTLCRECHFTLGHKRNWTNSVPEIAILFKQTVDSPASIGARRSETTPGHIRQ